MRVSGCVQAAPTNMWCVAKRLIAEPLDPDFFELDVAPVMHQAAHSGLDRSILLEGGDRDAVDRDRHARAVATDRIAVPVARHGEGTCSITGGMQFPAILWIGDRAVLIRADHHLKSGEPRAR